jgi:hypothetical protein
MGQIGEERFPRVTVWLRIVRTLALCSLAAILLPWYAAMFRVEPPAKSL